MGGESWGFVVPTWGDHVVLCFVGITKAGRQDGETDMLKGHVWCFMINLITIINVKRTRISPTEKHSPFLNTTLEIFTSSGRINLHGIPKATNLKKLDGSHSRPLITSHSLCLQFLIRILDGAVRRSDGCKREDHDAEAHLAGLVNRDQGTMTVLDDVKQQRPWCEVDDGLTCLLFAFEAFQQAAIGAEGASSTQTSDRFVVTELLICVRASDEHNVRVSLVFGCLSGTNTRQIDVQGYHFLAREVATAFSQYLVLDVEACDVGSDVMFDG